MNEVISPLIPLLAQDFCIAVLVGESFTLLGLHTQLSVWPDEGTIDRIYIVPSEARIYDHYAFLRTHKRDEGF